MTTVAVKEKLLDYIEHATEAKLQAIYTLLETEIEQGNCQYDDKIIAMLEESRTEYIKSGKKGYTAEESIEFVKEQMKKRGL